jgi:hypothetical protein
MNKLLRIQEDHRGVFVGTLSRNSGNSNIEKWLGTTSESVWSVDAKFYLNEREIDSGKLVLGA